MKCDVDSPGSERRLLGIAVGCVGGAITTAAVVQTTLAVSLFRDWTALGAVIGVLLIAASILIVLSSYHRRRTKAWFRLDCFMPVLRRTREGESAPFARQPLRLLRSSLPSLLFSDRNTKQRGLVRRALRRVGPTWLAAPVRRIVQTICFIGFLVLFFHVCWPYSARPESPGDVARSWNLTDVGQDDGMVWLENVAIPSWIAAGKVVYLVDESARDVAEGAVATLSVEQVRGGQLQARLDRIHDDKIDKLLVSPGPWALHEKRPGRWSSHYADDLDRKELVPAELFLVMDPLVSLSTAIASRSWVWSLLSAVIILTVSVLIPRGFCGYLCPLGTLIDMFDWIIGKRITRFRVSADGWWVHLKYYLLLGTLLCAFGGVLVSGYVAAIPVITRGMLFLGEPLQSGLMRGRHLVPAMNAGHVVSVVLFFAVLGLGLLRPRFWCKYVCPSGATFSVANLFRATERKVESTCINCNKCVEVCPFDAIKPDFTTRETDCTLCQTCAGVCPTHAIKFVERWNVVELKVENDPPTHETAIGRRGFLSLATGTAAAAVGAVGVTAATRVFGANLDNADAVRPVRPPGSVPEREFLEMCIRCGECFKVCPNNVLQSEGFEQGIEGLWAPLVKADWAGCESSCNACGQVCPTGAIRALPLEEKKVARMGLAIVNPATCLPFAGREECDLCVQECNAAGYHAIEYIQVGTEVDETGDPIEGTGFLAPVVLPDKCVGCGLCQTRCYGINVKVRRLFGESAIIVEAGEGKEDRLMTGSYVELREIEARQRGAATQERRGRSAAEYYIPSEPTEAESPSDAPDDPFGVGGGSEDDSEPDPFGLNAQDL